MDSVGTPGQHRGGQRRPDHRRLHRPGHVDDEDQPPVGLLPGAGAEDRPFRAPPPPAVVEAAGVRQVGPQRTGRSSRPTRPAGRARVGQPGQRRPQPGGQLPGQLLDQPPDQRPQPGQLRLRQAAGQGQHRGQQLHRGAYRGGVELGEHVDRPGLGGPGQDLLAYRGAEQRLQLLGPLPSGRERALPAAAAPPGPRSLAPSPRPAPYSSSRARGVARGRRPAAARTRGRAAAATGPLAAASARRAGVVAGRARRRREPRRRHRRRLSGAGRMPRRPRRASGAGGRSGRPGRRRRRRSSGRAAAGGADSARSSRSPSRSRRPPQQPVPAGRAEHVEPAAQRRQPGQELRVGQAVSTGPAAGRARPAPDCSSGSAAGEQRRSSRRRRRRRPSGPVRRVDPAGGPGRRARPASVEVEQHPGGQGRALHQRRTGARQAAEGVVQAQPERGPRRPASARATSAAASSGGVAAGQAGQARGPRRSSSVHDQLGGPGPAVGGGAGQVLPAQRLQQVEGGQQLGERGRWPAAPTAASASRSRDQRRAGRSRRRRASPSSSCARWAAVARPRRRNRLPQRAGSAAWAQGHAAYAGQVQQGRHGRRPGQPPAGGERGRRRRCPTTAIGSP